jgi:hypothetical protein
MKGGRLVGVYGRPWSKLASEPIPITRETLARLGEAIVEAIVAEAKKDLAREGKPVRGEPEGLPNSKRFFESFGYRISGSSTVEVTCSWPYIEQIVEGRPPAPMTKLTLARGGEVVPIKTGPDTVIFRVVPPKLSNAWIHPGFARHNFVKRGVTAGKEAMLQIIAEEALTHFLKGNPFK